MTKILLVEDDKSLREIYGVRLLAEGYQIVSAGDGEEALAMAVKERPGLIIADVMMPKISGFDMLDILRSTPETKDIKVIIMTALSSEDQRARGESLGANRYLVKSQVGIEDVVRTVHDILADAPVAATPTAVSFGAPAASAIITPQPTDTLKPFTPPMAPPMQPSVAAPISTPPEITPAPITTQIPVQMTAEPVSQPQMTATPATTPFTSQLPQPTAPFSTSPITAPSSQMPSAPQQPATSDIAPQIAQELNIPPTPQA